MTERRKFIRAAFVAFRPKREQFRDALSWARDAWDFLSANGEGEAKPHEPRDTGVDWYAKLEEDQRRAFDRFWKAYGYKKGKAGAAMRWAQLFESSRARPAPTVGAAHGRDDSGAGLDAERIIQAAAAEARAWRENPPQGQARIYAQGWLTERRWEDYEPLTPTLSQGAREPGASVKTANLLNEIASLKTLIEATAPGPGRSLLEAKLAGLEAQRRG